MGRPTLEGQMIRITIQEAQAKLSELIHRLSPEMTC